MPERQLDELADLGHLLAHTTNVVVADLAQVGLLVLALDRLALGVDHGVRCDLMEGKARERDHEDHEDGGGARVRTSERV